MADIIVFVALGVLLVLLLLAIVTGKFSGKGIGPASITAFHDFQPKDKQEAIEIIVEQKAGKNWVEQDNGLGVGETINELTSTSRRPVVPL